MEALCFKRGSDLVAQPEALLNEIASCESCGAHIEAAAAADNGWQVAPPVCPDCLRWVASAGPGISRPPKDLRIERHGRFWAVYEGETLLCLTVYLKGARAVEKRLEGESDGSR